MINETSNKYEKAIDMITVWIERIEYYSLELPGKIDLQLLVGAMKAGIKELKINEKASNTSCKWCLEMTGEKLRQMNEFYGGKINE